MIEAEWLACADPQVMLEFLRGKASDRKLRLFACACCRRVLHLVSEPSLRDAVEVTERYQDGLVSNDKYEEVWKTVYGVDRSAEAPPSEWAAADAEEAVLQATRPDGWARDWPPAWFAAQGASLNAAFALGVDDLKLSNRSFATWTRAHHRKPRRTDCSFVPRLLCLEDRLVLDAVSAGPNGIDARSLRTATGAAVLDGTNISIGQVEEERPGSPALGDNAANSHPHVNPTQVFLYNGNAVANQNTGLPNDTDGHGTMVAGVMVANAGADAGVSASAKLFASAVPSVPNRQTDQENAVVSMQHVAR
jgi:subtilisin family serine protease